MAKGWLLMAMLLFTAVNSTLAFDQAFKSLLTVLSGNPTQLGPLLVDMLVAKITRSGCSVVDGFIAEGIIEQVNLRLYYGMNEIDYDEVSLKHAADLTNSVHYNTSRCVAVYIFGYSSSPSNEYTRDVIEAYVQRDEYNVLLLDWSAATSLHYEVTVDLIGRVAERAGDALAALQEAGARLCLLSGHSLGAHHAGAAARRLRRLGHPVPQVVGLDAADPLFDDNWLQCAPGLRPEDAQCVEVLHTDIGAVGSYQRRGHVDLYANGGLHGQPGCNDSYNWLGVPTGSCSHVRAVRLWSSALRGPAALPARLCESEALFLAGRCDRNPTLLLGRCSQQAHAGKYYMSTNAEAPFYSTNPRPGGGGGVLGL